MRRPLKLGLLVTTALIMAAFLIAPLMLDHESLRQSLAEELGNALGHPVAIESLQITLFPRPTVELLQVTVDLGAPATTGLAIGRLRAVLSWHALVRGELVLPHLNIEAVQLDHDLVARIRDLFPLSGSADAAAALPVRLREMTIRGLTWKTAESTILGPFDTKLSWKDALRPAVIEFRQGDGKLHVRLLPDPAGVMVALQARDWAPPGRPQWRFSRLQAEGRYADRGIEVASAEGESFGGNWQFAGALAWGDVWQLRGQLTATDLELPLLLALTGNPPIPGHIDGQCVLSLRAPTPDTLVQAPGLDCALEHRIGLDRAQIGLHTEPAATGLAYRVDAEHLTLPVGPALHFQQIEASGLLHEKTLGIDQMSISAYRGRLKGSGKLEWGAGWLFGFDVDVQGMEIEPLLATFDQQSLSGLIDANCNGALQAKTFTSLGAHPDLGCKFRITDGIIFAADLERAATLVRGSTPAAGSTPFDTLEGKLRLVNQRTQFDPIRVHSSALEAAGAVGIAPDRQLSGELSVGLKHTGGMVSVPLVVSGTTDDPVIRPTNSALAGGAAGTLMLGPGIGTAIGVKVGEAVQKLGRWLQPKAGDAPAEARPR